jgi:AraC-like DNA-binding protein
MPPESRVFEIAANPWQADEQEVPHVHSGSEWNLIVRGQAERLVGESVLRMGPGTLAQVPPGVVHGMVQSSPELRLWVIWDPLPNELSEAGARSLPRGGFADLIRLARLCAEHRAEESLQGTLFQALRALMQHHWQHSDRPVQSAAIHTAVQEAVTLLHASDGLMDLQTLAQRVGLSRSRLGHLFSEQIGMGLHAYRGRCLLQAFDAARLANPDHDLASVAIASGFRNYMHCYRTHMRLRGVPPSYGA